ncbi:tyrosine-type recombinase/integrase [uncultured Gordonia sp.]|uniref:tyrosine-type recombinase/integrase n=1 Tax=uncultured Gordonia sp. TaxID=198437 RepID=UPI00262E46B0|nr:tyrosine-type recombinase/integrase [uncultured Gordonia sp.]
MSRHHLAIGTYGRISRAEQADGTWLARCRYRDADGKTRQVKAFGATGAKAETRLRDALLARQRRHDGDAKLTADSTIAQLLDAWMTVNVRQGVGRGGKPRSTATVDSYQGIVDHIVKPGLGGVLLREADTQKIDRFLLALPAVSSQRSARTVLTQAFRLAVVYRCLPVNPVVEAHRPPPSLSKPRALTPADVQTLRQRVREWQDAQKLGPKRAHDLVEIVDVMLGTGARIGEVLALRWVDIAGLDDDGPVTVTMCGTVKSETGRGCHRQPWTKTDAGHRTVTIPAWTADSLRRQRDRGIPSAEGLVFCTRTGGPRWTSNVRTQWRAVRGEDYEWVKPHTLRKTAGTMVAHAMGVEAAAAMLGHSSTAITERHYIERARIAPDSSAALDALG